MPSDQHQTLRIEHLSKAYYMDIIHEIIDILVKPSILVHVDVHFQDIKWPEQCQEATCKFRSGYEKQVPDFSICAFLQ